MNKIPCVKPAFTLVELIFVIVIIGILAGVASSTFKDNTLSNDAQFILAKIRQAQYRGIGYEHNGFGIESAVADYNKGCIRLEKSALQESANSGNLSYTLRVDTFDAGTLCFDAKGRPHNGDFTTGTLLSGKKVINLNVNGKTKSIFIFPVSGYAIIDCN